MIGQCRNVQERPAKKEGAKADQGGNRRPSPKMLCERLPFRWTMSSLLEVADSLKSQRFIHRFVHNV